MKSSSQICAALATTHANAHTIVINGNIAEHTKMYYLDAQFDGAAEFILQNAITTPLIVQLHIKNCSARQLDQLITDFQAIETSLHHSLKFYQHNRQRTQTMQMSIAVKMQHKDMFAAEAFIRNLQKLPFVVFNFNCQLTRSTTALSADMQVNDPVNVLMHAVANSLDSQPSFEASTLKTTRLETELSRYQADNARLHTKLDLALQENAALRMRLERPVQHIMQLTETTLKSKLFS
jgi:hypothetical protein